MSIRRKGLQSAAERQVRRTRRALNEGDFSALEKEDPSISHSPFLSELEEFDQGLNSNRLAITAETEQSSPSPVEGQSETSALEGTNPFRRLVDLGEKFKTLFHKERGG